MKKLLLVLSLVILTPEVNNPLASAMPLPSQQVSPEVQKVLRQIKKNNPSIQTQYSLTLATTIVRTAKKYNLSPRLLAAILMQESSYKISAKNIKCGISINTGKEDCVVVDFGIGQINHKTIKAFHFDKTRLLSDVEYSIDASAKVLADFKKSHAKDTEFWTRYNASSPDKRTIYKNLVARYM